MINFAAEFAKIDAQCQFNQQQRPQSPVQAAQAAQLVQLGQLGQVVQAGQVGPVGQSIILKPQLNVQQKTPQTPQTPQQAQQQPTYPPSQQQQQQWPPAPTSGQPYMQVHLQIEQQQQQQQQSQMQMQSQFHPQTNQYAQYPQPQVSQASLQMPPQGQVQDNNSHSNGAGGSIASYVPTIFASIASYRDPELIPTVFDLIAKSNHPERITIAICQQLLEEDENGLLDIRPALSNASVFKREAATLTIKATYLFGQVFYAFLDEFRHLKTNVLVKVVTMGANMAKGPMLARAVIEQVLYGGERFYLLVDSHMLFHQGHDDLYLREYNKICEQLQRTEYYQKHGNLNGFFPKFHDSIESIDDLPKAVLTCYPYDYVPNKNMAMRRPMAGVEKMPPPYLHFKKMHNVTISGSDLQRHYVDHPQVPESSSELSSSTSSLQASKMSSRPNTSSAFDLVDDDDNSDIKSTTGSTSSLTSQQAQQGSNKQISESKIRQTHVAAVMGFRPRNDKYLLSSEGFKYNTMGFSNRSNSSLVTGTASARVQQPFAKKEASSASSTSAGGSATGGGLSGMQAFMVPQQDRYPYTNVPAASTPMLPSCFWAACFSFAPASMLMHVPYDPYCPYVFIGEEYSMAMRLYSHGFQLFAPNVQILYHLTNREYRPTYWEQFLDNTQFDLGSKLKNTGPTPVALSTTVSNMRTPASARIAATMNSSSNHNPLSASVSTSAFAKNFLNLKQAKVTAQEKKERRFLMQQGYTRLYDLIIGGFKGKQLYVPRFPKDQITNHRQRQPVGDILELDLTETDAQNPKYSLGPHATVADFEAYTGVYTTSQKLDRRANMGLTPHYKGTPEEVFKQPFREVQSTAVATTNGGTGGTMISHAHGHGNRMGLIRGGGSGKPRR